MLIEGVRHDATACEMRCPWYCRNERAQRMYLVLPRVACLAATRASCRRKRAGCGLGLGGSHVLLYFMFGRVARLERALGPYPQNVLRLRMPFVKFLLLLREIGNVRKRHLPPLASALVPRNARGGSLLRGMAGASASATPAPQRHLI